MDASFAMLPFLIFIVFGGGIAIYAYYANKRRREMLTSWAQSRGWQHHGTVKGMTRRWSGPPMSMGGATPAREVLTGPFHGYQALSFQYQYTTSNGKNSTTHYYHVIALHLPVALPWLQLSPEGVGSRIGKFFGGQDIQFESQAFNDEWRIQGPEGQFPFDFIHPRMMERLMQPDARGRSICVEGQDIYVWMNGRQDVNRIDHTLNLLLGIIQQVPRHLWLRVGHDPDAGRWPR